MIFPTFTNIVVTLSWRWCQEIRTTRRRWVSIKMSVIIQMMMLCFGGIILLATKTDPRDTKWRGI
ncbi:hypothetical protein O9992_21515 [Vibrio lentus]|nr:hypothetical protein [Vibrio lentus]